jgi:hypothetical protein
MGLSKIEEKLNRALQEDITSEYQVIFILSRIRKCLEIKEEKRKYKFLNFYCNWALHAKIDRTEPVADVLRDFLNKKDDEKFLSFDYLNLDLDKFLKTNKFSTRILDDTENYLRFINILVDIYVDTPIEFYPEEKKTIIIRKPPSAIKNMPFSIHYEIL